MNDGGDRLKVGPWNTRPRIEIDAELVGAVHVLAAHGVPNVMVADAAGMIAAHAARECLERAGVKAAEVDLIIVATVTPDMPFPATACLVQDRIKATKAWGFDINAACSGFPYALTVGAQFVETGAARKVLVIGADVMTAILDYTERSTCVLFGDGAGAVLLEPREDGTGILDFLHEVDGTGGHQLYMSAGGSLHPASHETVDKKMHCIRQEGPAVFKFAVRKFAEVSANLLERNRVKAEDLDLFVPHQANLRIAQFVQQKLKLSDDQVYNNIQQYGNTTAASVPIALCEAWEKGKIKDGDLVCLAAFGSGFTWASALLRW